MEQRKETVGQDREVRKDDRGRDRDRRGVERKEDHPPQARPDGTGKGRMGAGLWRPPRDRIGSSPARYKEWAPRPCPGSRAEGGDSCLSAAVSGGPRPSPRFAV